MSKVRGGQVYVEIGADPRKLFKALTDLNRNIGRIGASMQNLGTRMLALGTAIGAPLALATRQFATFDDAIRATAAVSGATGAALQSLNDKARELGATTSFTAVQVANLMTELGRAGFRPDEIERMTGAVLDLARATGTDATLSAGIMAATLRQFGLEAGDAARAADVLTKAANATFNTVEGLGESLKYAGPVAKSLGMSLEDTVAVLGVLGNVGIQGSEAGTALRRLSVISAGAGKELKALFGVSNTDAAGGLKPLVDVLDEINTATAGMPVADRTAKMAQAFGLLGITSANVLSQTAGGVRDLAVRLRAAEGTAARTAKEMDAGLGGAMRITLSAIEGTALAIGDALSPSLQRLIQFVGNASGAFTQFVKENEALVVSMSKGLALFTASGVALLSLGAVVSVASAAFGSLLAAAAAVIAPITATAAAMGGVVVSFAAAIAKVLAYGTASVAAAATSTAAWLAANAAAAVMVASLGFIAVNALALLGGFQELRNAAVGLGNAARGAMGVLSEMGETAKKTFAGIYGALDSGDMERAMAVGMAGLRAVFSQGASSFMNAVDEWGVNLVNAFDFYISQIPFLRFLGPDKYEFSVFGNSTDGQSADQRADARGAAMFERQDARRNQQRQIAQDFERVLKDSRLADGLRAQARDLMESIAGAENMRSLKDLGEEFRALRDTGKLTTDQVAKLDEALDLAAERITEANSATLPGGVSGGAGGSGFTDDGLGGQMSGLLSGEGKTPEERRRTAFDDQASDVMSRLRSTWNEDEMRQAADEARALIQTRAVGRDVAEQLKSAIKSAALDLDPAAIEAETRRQAADQAEAAGSFSAMAIGGMGFGSTVAERQLEELTKIRKGVADMAEEGALAVLP